MLISVGKALSHAVRESDLACRYGGDEFCVILPRSDTDEAKRVADRIVESFQSLVGEELSFSAGISTTGPKEFTSAEKLLRQADHLMFKGKDLAHELGGIRVMVSEDDGVNAENEEPKSDKSDGVKDEVDVVTLHTHR